MSSNFTEEALAAFLQSDHGTAPAAEPQCAEMPVGRPPKPSDCKTTPKKSWKPTAVTIGDESRRRATNPKPKGPPRQSIEGRFPRTRIKQNKSGTYYLEVQETWWANLLGTWSKRGVHDWPVFHPFEWDDYVDALQYARNYRYDFNHNTIPNKKFVRNVT